MRLAVLLAIVVLAVAVSQPAANPIGITPWGNLDLFADHLGTEELIFDNAPALLLIYVVMVSGPPAGVTGVQFAATRPACFNAMWLSDTNVFPVVIGNTQVGVSVGFGSCRSYPLHVLTINYFGQGTTLPCCYYWVRPDPMAASGEIEGADCGFQVVYLDGGATIVNRPEAGCPIATEPSTWGKVKSLFAE